MALNESQSSYTQTWIPVLTFCLLKVITWPQELSTILPLEMCTALGLHLPIDSKVGSCLLSINSDGAYMSYEIIVLFLNSCMLKGTFVFCFLFFWGAAHARQYHSICGLVWDFVAFLAIITTVNLK